MEKDRRTIAAVATAQGTGGIAVIRISGPEALSVLKGAFSHRGKYESHRMYYGFVLDENGAKLDEAMAVYMKAPRSYTAEDVAEIQCHGGSVAAERTLNAVLCRGARLAEPGEFTKRAFLNGRIDLTQAEAVMQLISAGSEAAARAGMRQLTGGVSAKIRPILDDLTGIRALIEASDDFPEEIDEESGSVETRRRLLDVRARIAELCDERAARIVRRGSCVVLAGRPNVGKSSLMNRLLGTERAIVTDVPGTTRDAVSAHLTINGVDVELTDTAGRRDTEDAVEKIGVERAKQAAEQADLALLVLDDTAGITDEDRAMLESADERWAVCVNKRDLSEKIHTEFICREYAVPVIAVSASTGAGIDLLKALIADRVCPAEPPLVAQRHIEAAKRALSALDEALASLDSGFPMDVCAVNAAQALDALGEITGENLREAVIDRVFRDFCVGK